MKNLNFLKQPKFYILVVSILFILIILSGCFDTIPTGYIGIKTRFGKAKEGTLQEGLNLKLPFIEKIVKIDCRIKKVESISEASTKDLQTVTTSIALNYNVNKDIANKLYREIGVDYENIIISPAILESVKSAMAQYTAEELITKRAEVSNQIQTALVEKISDKGFTVAEFNLTNINFSPEYDEAIEAKAVKQQEVVAAKADLEKQQIQNEKEISIAEKDAKVMELQNSQVTENTLRLKELEVKKAFVDKWNGIAPNTIVGDGVNALLNLN